MIRPNPETEAFLYEALGQGLIQPGLWHIDGLFLSKELEIRSWAIRPEYWFGETTLTARAVCRRASQRGRATMVGRSARSWAARGEADAVGRVPLWER
jgi:hypothetical protein